MKDKCNRCLYSCPVNVGDDCEMLRACVYILIKSEKRPCKPGNGCTVYEPRGRRRRKPCL